MPCNLLHALTAIFCYVSNLGRQSLVDVEQKLDAAFADVQGREVRKKVVPDEKTLDKVVFN